jgi:hypothetical protein
MALERDGIGLYSRELHRYLSKLCEPVPLPLDAETHDRTHYRRLADAANRCDLLHVEHAHPFFKLPFFPFREAYLGFLRRVTVPRIAVYHEPLETVPLYRPPDGGTLSGRLRSRGLHAAMAIARFPANAFWLPWHNREIFSIPERVVVHTEYRAEMVRRFAPNARVFVVPLPVYIPPAEGAGGTGIQELPFDEGDFIMTVFGFIDRRKDYLGVLEAMTGLPGRFKLLIAGGCHDEREYRSADSPYGRLTAFVGDHGLEARVHVTRFCPDSAIPGIMARTGVVIAPFTQDHSSGSINMGLAYARPILAYRTLLTEEMNRNGAGLLIVDGKGGLKGAILSADADPGIYSRAVAGGAGYRSSFGFPAAAERFAGWYRELLEGG